MSVCSVPGCERKYHSRGFCGAHYQRWRKYGDPLLSGDRHAHGAKHLIPIETRFWNRVDKTDGGCWLWTGAQHRPGHSHNYGEVWRDGKRIYAHRASYEMAYGPLEPGMHVCHKCDTPLCVRPEHLFAGTHADNMRDMWSKGRQGGYWIPGAKGTRHV